MRRSAVFALVAWVVAFGPRSMADDTTYRSHVVVCQQADAADAGRDAMRRGGNAVDAAVATAMALAVTHPAAGNLGGGGFIVAYLAESKEIVTVDFREAAPLASTERMYLGPDGKPVAGHRAGPRAAGVPGTVRGLALAHAKWGKLPWADLVKPAARLARDGFPITETLARSLNSQLYPKAKVTDAGVAEDLGDDPDRLADFRASVEAYAKPDRKPWVAGELLIQRDLADTLDRIATEGPDEFYTGKTAGKIVAHMKALGGIITREDLARYQAKARPPVHGHLSRLRHLRHGPSRFRRDRDPRSPQYPRTIQPQGRRPSIAGDPPPRDRSDASRVFHPGNDDRRPRFRRGAGREARLQAVCR